MGNTALHWVILGDVGLCWFILGNVDVGRGYIMRFTAPTAGFGDSSSVYVGAGAQEPHIETVKENWLQLKLEL